MEMMLGVFIGVLVIEVDKVADEETNMEVDKLIHVAPPVGQIFN